MEEAIIGSINYRLNEETKTAEVIKSYRRYEGGIEIPETVKVKLASDGDTITINKIIAFAYDRDAVVATMDRSRFVSIYDQWNDRNVFKLTANRRYIADPSENAIIYLND